MKEGGGACKRNFDAKVSLRYYGINVRKKRNHDDEGLTPTKDGGTCLRRLSMFRKEVH